MRICMLTTSYPRGPGDSAGTFVAALAREMVSALGLTVRVVAPHAPGARLREELDGVDVWRFRYAWPLELQRLCYDGGIPANLKARTWTRALVPGFLLAFVGAAVGGMIGCDVTHCHWTVSGMVGLVARALCPMPVVVTTRGSDLALARSSWGMRQMARHVVRHAQAVTIVGSAQRQDLATIGCPAEKILHIPNGIDRGFLDRPSSRGRSLDVLFVGRLAPEKRPLLLLEALACLAAEGLTLSADFIGEGPLEGDMRVLLSRRGLRNVRLLGSMPPPLVREAMDRARCLVLVSSREGMPNVVLQAMARATPVLACDVGSVSDVIRNGETGLLLDPHVRAEALARILGCHLAGPGQLRALGVSARRFVRARYSWGRAAERFAELYSGLVRCHGRPCGGGGSARIRRGK